MGPTHLLDSSAFLGVLKVVLPCLEHTTQPGQQARCTLFLAQSSKKTSSCPPRKPLTTPSNPWPGPGSFCARQEEAEEQLQQFHRMWALHLERSK